MNKPKFPSFMGGIKSQMQKQQVGFIFKAVEQPVFRGFFSKTHSCTFREWEAMRKMNKYETAYQVLFLALQHVWKDSHDVKGFNRSGFFNESREAPLPYITVIKDQKNAEFLSCEVAGKISPFERK